MKSTIMDILRKEFGQDFNSDFKILSESFWKNQSGDNELSISNLLLQIDTNFYGCPEIKYYKLNYYFIFDTDHINIIYYNLTEFKKL